MDPERLVFKAVRHMFATRLPATKRHSIETRNNVHVTHCKGNLLMDVSLSASLVGRANTTCRQQEGLAAKSERNHG